MKRVHSPKLYQNSTFLSIAFCLVGPYINSSRSRYHFLYQLKVYRASGKKLHRHCVNYGMEARGEAFTQRWLSHRLTYSLTYSLPIHALTYPPTQSLTHSLTFLLTELLLCNTVWSVSSVNRAWCWWDQGREFEPHTDQRTQHVASMK